MKIWVTRNSAFSIQCGGLERLFVWFRKPVWVEEWRDRASYDTPFGEESEMNGARTSDWEIRKSGTLWIDRPVSFGKLFGYCDRNDESENDLATYVWNKLEEHFDNKEFDIWHELERSGEHKYQRYNFCLEIDLEIKMK